MREVIVHVTCDACREDIEEESDGDHCVVLTVGGQQREIDLCGNCLYGSFLQEARPVAKTKSKKKTEDVECRFPCDRCDKSFNTQRGLSRHQTVTHEEGK